MKSENNTVIDTVLGDTMKITGVDVTVNMISSSFLGGGEVDGAIHRAAGRGLLHECRLLGGCRIGQAKIINTYNMDCRYIIHTVGPMWNGGIYGEQEKLSSCHRNSFLLAPENGAKQITFPFVPTGICHFPVELAAGIAIGTTREFMAEHPGELEHTLRVPLDARMRPAYNTVLRKL